jgi:predicted nucleic acid-binding protein
MILFEFANKILRHEFNISKEKLGLKAPQYKVFRETENYKVTTSLVANCIRKIAKFTKICYLNRDDNDLLYELVDDFASENCDFNDMVFAKICKENKLTFVTHDEDFKNYGIKVITANRSLLKSSQYVV